MPGLETQKGRGFLAPAFGSLSLSAEEQDARRLVFSHFAYRTVEELVVFEVNLEEGRTLGNTPGNQCFRQWILNVALQGTAQRTRAIRSVDQRLFQNPLLGIFGHRQGDRLLNQVGIQLLYQQLQDLNQIGIRERHEDDDFVQTV